MMETTPLATTAAGCRYCATCITPELVSRHSRMNPHAWMGASDSERPEVGPLCLERSLQTLKAMERLEWD
jgi:hypothetical protein